MDDQHITLRMSIEEVLTLAAITRVRAIPGLGENLFGGFSQEQLRLVLSAGSNSLQAKGWIQPSQNPEQPGQMAVDEAVLALFGTCAGAGRVLYVSRLPLNAAPHNWYVHLGEYLAVLHRLISPGVHEFLASVERGDILKEIYRLLELDAQTEALPAAAVRLAQADFQAALDLARQGQPEAAQDQLVSSAGLPADTACLLVHSMENIQANSLVAMMQVASGDKPSEAETVSSFSILQSAGMLWQMKAASEPGGICIQSISSPACRDEVARMLAG